MVMANQHLCFCHPPQLSAVHLCTGNYFQRTNIHSALQPEQQHILCLTRGKIRPQLSNAHKKTPPQRCKFALRRRGMEVELKIILL